MNWLTDVAPVANDSLVFDQNVRLAAANNITAATQFNGITFATSAGAFTLSGNSITLGGDIANNSLNAETSSNALALNATRSVDVASRMGSLTLSGVISGSTFGITKTGSGILTLSGANTFTGGVTINGGVISISADGTGTAQQLGSGAAGAGTLTLNGGTLRTTGNTTLSVNRRVTLGAFGGTIDVNSGTTLTYNGVISGGANAITKTGTGTLALGGANTYTGSTNVNEGTLKIDFTAAGAPTTDIINSGSTLVLGGAPTTVNAAGNTGPGVTLNMTSKSAANSTQTFNGLQLGYGTTTGGGALATISTTQTASGNNLLNLGAITHNAGGTVNFSLAGAFSSGVNAITTTTGNSNGILGGWATYAGTSYAANDGSGNIVAYTGYTPISTGATIANAAASNVQVQTTGAVALSTANAATTDINTLSLSSAATGATTVTVGTAGTGSTGILRLGANGGLMVATGGGSLTIGNVANNGTLTAGGADNTAGEITLSGATVNSKITDNGTGAVTVTINNGTLTGANTYSGGTFVQTGFTQAGNTAAFGTGAVTALQGTQIYMNLAGTIANDFYIAGGANGLGVLRFEETLSGKITLIGDARVGTNNRSGTLSGQITGGYNLEFGSGVLNGNITLSNPSGTNFNNWTGNTSINTILLLGSNTGDLIPDGSGKGNVNIVSNNFSILDLNGKTETINGLGGGGSVRNNATGTNVTFTLGNNDATTTYTGTIVDHTAGTGTVAITKTGAGTQTLTNINTYTGGTTVNSGTLALGHATNTLADTGAVNVNGGTLSLSTNSDTVGAVTLTSGSITGTTGVLTGSSYAVQSGTVSGILGGSGALTKSTAGTVALTNANTYSGGTTVAGGTLLIGAANALSGTTGAIVVNAGTLSSNLASATLGGDLTLSGGTVTADDSSVGSFTLASGKNFLMTSGTLGLTFASLTSDQILGSGAGTFTLSGGTLDLTNTVPDYLATYQIFSGFGSGSVGGLFFTNYDTSDYTANLSNGGVLSFTAVPEPSTYALLGMGLAGLFLRRRNARKKSLINQVVG